MNNITEILTKDSSDLFREKKRTCRKSSAHKKETQKSVSDNSCAKTCQGF